MRNASAHKKGVLLRGGNSYSARKVAGLISKTNLTATEKGPPATGISLV